MTRLGPMVKQGHPFAERGSLNRRRFLERSIASQLFGASLVPPVVARISPPASRVRPGTAGWPSAADWEGLRRRPASVCSRRRGRPVGRLTPGGAPGALGRCRPAAPGGRWSVLRPSLPAQSRILARARWRSRGRPAAPNACGAFSPLKLVTREGLVSLPGRGARHSFLLLVAAVGEPILRRRRSCFGAFPGFADPAQVDDFAHAAATQILPY